MPDGTVRGFPTNERQQHLSAGPWGSFKMGGGVGLSRDNTTCVALGGESPGGLLRDPRVFGGRRGGVGASACRSGEVEGPLRVGFGHEMTLTLSASTLSLRGRRTDPLCVSH